MSFALTHLHGFGSCREACGCTPAYDSGDRTASITVTTNATLNGNPTNLVDGGTASNTTDGLFFASGSTPVANLHFTFDFGAGARVKITEAKNQQVGTSTDGTWRWQASQDNATWVDIGATFTLGGATTQTMTTLSGNTKGYRYYRILGVSGNTAASSHYFLEWTFLRCNC